MMRLILALLLALVALPAAAQRAPDSFPGCVYNATPPTLADRQTVPWQCDINGNLLIAGGGGGSGTVTSVSVVSANGFAGSVATATTTPAITLSTTITGILSGNGTAVSAASTTGSGAVVLATSPTLVTPALGTPSAIVLTNATGLPVGALTGLGAGVAAWLATPSSANLATAVTDETGSGSLVFATSPTLVTPVLGVASATSINKVALTAPASSATLTIADGKTLTASNTLTFAGTDGSTLNIGTGGTLGTAAYKNTGTSGNTVPLLDGANTWSTTQLFPDGTASAPSIGFATTPGVGFAYGSTTSINVTSSTIVGVTLGAGGVALRQSGALSWANGSTATGTIDLFLVRDAANTLAQRNSTNSQTFRVYNTFTDASNYERLGVSFSSSVPQIAYEAAGTGTAARNINLITNGQTWTFNSAGTTSFPNSITTNGTGNINTPNGGTFGWGSGRSAIRSPSNGVISFYNDAISDFSRLQLGGTTSSFPAIKRNGTGIDFRLADDSAYAPITTAAHVMSVAAPLSFTSGTNQRAGNATLVAGTVTVSNTTVTANTVVMLTRKTSGGTIGTSITYTLSAGSSFTITSDNVLDTSVFSYVLIEVP